MPFTSTYKIVTAKPEFPVNTFTSSGFTGSDGSVTGLAGGGFAVATNQTVDIYAADAGVVRSIEFDGFLAGQGGVSTLPDGSLLVSWTNSLGNAVASHYSALGELITTRGVPIGEGASRISVATLADGGFARIDNVANFDVVVERFDSAYNRTTNTTL